MFVNFVNFDTIMMNNNEFLTSLMDVYFRHVFIFCFEDGKKELQLAWFNLVRFAWILQIATWLGHVAIF